DPRHGVAHTGRGAVFAQLGRLDEALACYEEALRVRPDLADAHLNRALAWLLLGDYGRGWPEYEWRWKCKGHTPPPYREPRWDGSPLGGRTVLLHPEQGLGDTIQFVRYAPLVRARGGRVVLLCQKPLRRLLAGCPGVDELVAQGEELPAFDVHAPLMSLPALLGTTLRTVPADVPYLAADPDLVGRWRRELARLPGVKVGIAWQGNPDYPWDRHRSVPLREFAPLARVPGVCLVGLQKGPGTEQLRGLAGTFAVTEPGPRFDED